MKTSNLTTSKTPSLWGLSVTSLFLRFAIGGAMLTHGIPKIVSFSTLVNTFPNPIGMGATLSLVLVIFAEVVCSLFLIFGFLTRLATIPLIFNMAVIFFIIDSSVGFASKELPMMYLIIYIVILIIGPGNFSLDKIIFKK